MQYGVCNSRFFETFKGPESTRVYYGGGGSGKSLSLVQYFIIQLCNGDGQRRGIFRKAQTSMTNSTYLVIKAVLRDWDVPYLENKSTHTITVKNKDGSENTLSYLGLDDPEKIKGAEFAEIWLEETTEFNLMDYQQLTIRLSRDRPGTKIFMSFNPIDKDHWCMTELVDKVHEDDTIFVHHSTYHDNIRNLDQGFIDKLEGYINKDENFHRIYALGLPGVLKGQIYKDWDFSDPAKWSSGYKSGMHFYGIDFGFNAPMAMCEIWFYDGEYYIKELLYKSGLTTNDLVGRMEGMGISKTDTIYCDSAEPDRIQELCNSGYNADKSKKDVKAGIDFVKGSTIHVDATRSPNISTEYNNYKWKETKDGKSLDEPVKAFDHILDSVRYSCFTAPTEPIQAVSKVQIERPSFSGFASSRPNF